MEAPSVKAVASMSEAWLVVAFWCRSRWCVDSIIGKGICAGVGGAVGGAGGGGVNVRGMAAGGVLVQEYMALLMV